MKIHPKTEVIYGPPGTGKTTQLIRLVESMLGDASPEDIMFTSYTRTGAYVARDRALDRFDGDANRFKWFGTLHRVCFSLLGRPSVMQNKHKLEFGKTLGTSFTFQFQDEVQAIAQQTKGDALLYLHDMMVKTGKTLEQCRLEYNKDVSITELQHFSSNYQNYKAANNVIDFSDMLKMFLHLKSGDMPNIRYLIVDEAQDLFPLQWEVITKLAQKAEKVYIAGDDDQCIHAWSGSSPEFMMNLDAEKRVLPQSYRIPKKVHTIAEKIINKVKVREPKIYRPTTHEGEVIQITDLNSLPLEDVKLGSWLLLGRNRVFLERFDLACYQKHIRYKTVGKDETLTLGEAIRIWKQLEEGNCVTGAEVKVLYNFLKARDRVKHGYKKILESSLEDDRQIDIDDLTQDFGLLYTGSWQGAFFNRSDFEIDYYEKVEKNYGFFDKCFVRLSTIHSSKGDEADNVVILPDMTPKTYNGYQEDPDNEHRVFYVGVTRAKQRLYICQPQGGMFYEL